MTYDTADAYFTDFVTDLPKTAAGTHIGMYAAWATLGGLGGEVLNDYRQDLLSRRISCAEFVFDAIDGKLTRDDFTAEGAAFSDRYYTNYFADYERLFEREFTRTGHEVDDACSLADTWSHFDRLAPLLNRRLMEWRATQAATPQVPLPPLEAVNASMLGEIQGFLDAHGFTHDPTMEAQMIDPSGPGRIARVYGSRYPGGRHWLATILKTTPARQCTLSMIVASSLDVVAERIRDHGLPQHFRDPPPGSPPPYTAVLRPYQWLRTNPDLRVESDGTDGGAIVLRSADEVATTFARLRARLDGDLGPVLAKLATVPGLDELRCTRRLTDSILYTDPFNREILATAEVARNPRLLEICDELEVLLRDPCAPGERLYWDNGLAYVRQVRERVSRGPR